MEGGVEREIVWSQVSTRREEERCTAEPSAKKGVTHEVVISNFKKTDHWAAVGGEGRSGKKVRAEWKEREGKRATRRGSAQSASIPPTHASILSTHAAHTRHARPHRDKQRHAEVCVYEAVWGWIKKPVTQMRSSLSASYLTGGTWVDTRDMSISTRASKRRSGASDEACADEACASLTKTAKLST